MAFDLGDIAALGMGGHSLRFLNDDWNESISNGELYTLRWNQSVVKDGSELGLFKVTYPSAGVVVYELVTNLTDRMDTASCVFTPQGLGNNLYALWLSSGQHSHHNWTISPPWIPKEVVRALLFVVDAALIASTGLHSSNSKQFKTVKTRLYWATPIIIPVVCLLALYGLCLTTCMVYRRRKKAKREKEDATPHQDVSRNDSVDSAITVQTLTEADDGTEKPSDVWIFTNASANADVTVGGVQDTDITTVERGQGDEQRTHDEQAIGIGL